MKTIFKISIILFYVISLTNSNICFSQNIKVSDSLDYIKTAEKPTNIYIYDYEQLFASKESGELLKIILKYKEQTTKEILVVTTHSIGNFSNIQEYATHIGSIYSNEVKNENIVTIAVSKKLKGIAIATSPKAREILTDQINEYTINHVIIPRIKKGCLFEGIRLGINDLIKNWNNE